ncbi:MAG: transketolase family protein [Nanobdellota archaeon]
MESIRDGYGKGLLEAGKNNKIYALTADLKSSTRTQYFAEKYPRRFIQCGISEQNMMCVAAGIASLGKTPFVNSFAVFSPGRNWDQLRVSICYSNLNVKIHGSHAGLTVGKDGATHQALEDIAITRVLPNLKVVVPSDSQEAEELTKQIAKEKGPVYIRTSRHKFPIISNKSKIQLGKAYKLKTGKNLTIISCGICLHEALKAAEELKKEGISTEIINCHTIKPLDKKTILKSAKKTGKIITVEEHQKAGGLGSAVAELLSETKIPIKIIGIQDTFGESGTPEELLKKYKIDKNEIIKECREMYK